jgi:apolipoprotein N-acyltransferase
MTPARAIALGAAVLAGAATVYGYAPFGVAVLPIVTLGFLFTQWHRAPTPRDAAAQGYAFGLGLFGAGVSWVYIALENFGGMPVPIAIVATGAFIGYLALWPALAGYLAARLAAPSSLWRAIAAAATWTLAEILRGLLFTGFPWLAVGYSQLPGSPLAGYAPYGGVFVVSLASALLAAAIAIGVDALATGKWRPLAAGAALAAAIAIGGAPLARIEWTQPQGAPIAVSLVQGNVEQTLKFDPEFRPRTFEIYADLVAASRGQLVVLPESAFPMFADEVPDRVFVDLLRVATERSGTLLVGLFTAEAPLPGSEDVRYYNTVLSLRGGAIELYRKRHLVPFGETIPGKPLFGWFIRHVLAIPLADQTPGPETQAPFTVAGQKIAVNICYEDAFGRELIGAARSAGVLVNVTNDAWYGRSIAARQHNQIAAMRALELGRPMLRATNTGITSAIDHDGRVRAELPWFTRGVLETSVVARGGATPYHAFGDWLAASLAAALAACAAALGRRRVGGRGDIP